MTRSAKRRDGVQRLLKAGDFDAVEKIVNVPIPSECAEGRLARRLQQLVLRLLESMRARQREEAGPPA
jgi:hypothetical protein